MSSSPHRDAASLVKYFNEQDAFFPYREWPEWAQKDMVLCHKNRNQAYNLFYFLTSNGLAPEQARTWVMAKSHLNGHFQNPIRGDKYDDNRIADFAGLVAKAKSGALFAKPKKIMDMVTDKVSVMPISVRRQTRFAASSAPVRNKRTKKLARLAVAATNIRRGRQAQASLRRNPRLYFRKSFNKWVKLRRAIYDDAVSTLQQLQSQGFGNYMAPPQPWSAPGFSRPVPFVPEASETRSAPERGHPAYPSGASRSARSVPPDFRPRGRSRSPTRGTPEWRYPTPDPAVFEPRRPLARPRLATPEPLPRLRRDVDPDYFTQLSEEPGYGQDIRDLEIVRPASPHGNLLEAKRPRFFDPDDVEDEF